jgi:hypothetical protein
VEEIHLARDRDEWQVLVNIIMNLYIPFCALMYKKSVITINVHNFMTSSLLLIHTFVIDRW